MTPFPDMKERFRHSAAFLNMSVVALRNGTNSKVSNAILCSKHLAIRVGSINIVSYRWYWGDSSPRRRPTIIWRKGLKTQCMERRMAGWWKCFWYQGTLSLGINAIYVDLKNCGRRERAVPGLQPTAVVCNLCRNVQTNYPLSPFRTGRNASPAIQKSDVRCQYFQTLHKSKKNLG